MPVAFYLPGQIPVYASSLLLGLGGSLGLAWMIWGQKGRVSTWRLDLGLGVLAGALLGARVGFVAGDWSYFQSNKLEIPQAFLGGLSWVGAVSGGLLALIVTSGFKRQPVGSAGYAVLPLLTTLSACAWLGCWLDGCAYGKPVTAWWGLPARDEWGIMSLRWPLQLVGALFSFIWFGMLSRFASRLAPGLVFWIGLTGFSGGMLLLSFLRADASLVWRGMRAESWAAIALMSFSAGVALITFMSGAEQR